MCESTYTGAPDECSYHCTWGKEIVSLNVDGSCPRKEEHETFGPDPGYLISNSRTKTPPK